MANIFKKAFEKNAFNNRFSKKRSRKKEMAEAGRKKTLEDLQAPKDSEQYRKALRVIAREQTMRNATAFLRWITGTILLLLLLLGLYQFCGLQISSIAQNSKIPEVMREALLYIGGSIFISCIFGALLIIIGSNLVKRGLYHRPYKRGSLQKEMEESLKAEENPLEKKRNQTRRKHK